jgi:hypothetical protein
MWHFGDFSPAAPVSPTNKINHFDKAGILMKTLSHNVVSSTSCLIRIQRLW